MTNEEYERLMIRSYATKRHTGDEAASDQRSYYNNGGEILRWPEILLERARSPALKRAAERVAGATKQRAQNEESNLEELNMFQEIPMKGTYRPASAPLGKGKGLFGSTTEQGPFANDLLVSPPKAKETNRHRASREASPTGRGRRLKLDEPSGEADMKVDEDGIVEYGDTYVIENEEEAIHRIQAAMLSAVQRSASPQGKDRSRSRHRQTSPSRERGAVAVDEHEKKVGAGIYVSGKHHHQPH